MAEQLQVKQFKINKLDLLDYERLILHAIINTKAHYLSERYKSFE